jgi:hypothetical protein
MSYVVVDVRGVVFDLDHEDTQAVLNLGSPNDIKEFLAKVGTIAGVAVASGPVAIAIGAIAAWAFVEGAAIRSSDKGCGVILTWLPLFPVVIPATRDCRCNIPWHDWAKQDSGTFCSSGGDTVDFAIQRGVLDPSIASFALANNVGDDRFRS